MSRLKDALYGALGNPDTTLYPLPHAFGNGHTPCNVYAAAAHGASSLLHNEVFAAYVRDFLGAYVGDAYKPARRTRIERVLVGPFYADILRAGDEALACFSAQWATPMYAFDAGAPDSFTRLPRMFQYALTFLSQHLGIPDLKCLLVDLPGPALMVWTKSEGASDVDLSPYVADAIKGTGSIRVGYVSAAECANCALRSVCKHGADVAEPRLVDGRWNPWVRNKLEEQRLHSGVFAQNLKPSGRTTHCVHPSEVSTVSCDRAIAYSVIEEEPTGVTVTDGLRLIFDIGHATHAAVQEAIGRVEPEFVAEAPVHLRNLNVHGHADGLLGREVLEIKTTSSSMAEAQTPKKGHDVQVALYNKALDGELVVFFYIHKASWQVDVLDWTPRASDYNKAADRIVGILAQIREKKLPDQAGSTSECESCKWLTVCKGKKRKAAGGFGKFTEQNAGVRRFV